MGPTQVFAHGDSLHNKLVDRNRGEKTKTKGLLYRSVLCQCKVSFIPKQDIHPFKKSHLLSTKEAKVMPLFMY